MYIYKKDYTAFVSKIKELLEQYDYTSDGYAFYIETPCGKLRIAIEEFKAKKSVQWLYTRIENPDKVPERIRRRDYFNKFSGKHNNYSNDFEQLFNWLVDYIDCLMEVSNEN